MNNELAIRACRALVAAYQSAEDEGDDIDWQDIDDAHALACEALKESEAGPRWQCVECYGTNVQVDYPTWYRERVDYSTEYVEQADADASYFFCGDCDCTDRPRDLAHDAPLEGPHA